MNAEIIAVGSEMLTPSRIDTNSLWLTDQLNALGIEVAAKAVVGDDRELLAALLRSSLGRSGIVLISGGLGPTEDDVTREAVAQALGRGLHFDQAALDAIAERFQQMGRPMAENNRRQAFVIDGAEVLPNVRGTAPGQWIAAGARYVALLPGPPGELTAMYERELSPRLKALAPPLVIRTLTYRVTGIGESDLDQMIAPVYTRYTNPVTTVLAKPGDIEVHFRARCATEGEALALLAGIGPQIESLLGERIYSRDGTSLEETVGRLLRERGETLAVAESCTGGMLGERITAVAGSSDYFVGGYLVYNAAMKEQLGVERALISAHGEVSEEVAEAMARQARERAGATYGLGITGIAGPAGGSEAKPVGTVCIAIAAPGGCSSRRLRLPGDRARVRQFATQSALDMLRRRLTASRP